MHWRDTLQQQIRTLMQAQPIQRTRAQWLRLPPATRALPRHLWRTIMNFKNHGLRNAAALSYYAVFSVFPLILLLAVGVGSIVGPTVASEQIAEGVRLFLPQEARTINLIQDSVSQAVQQSFSFGIIALAGLIWSALGLFSNLTSSLDRIFQVPASRGMWRERVLAFFMTLGLIALVAVSFVTSGVLSLLDVVLLNAPPVWIRIGTFFLPFGLNLLIFVILFRVVPARHVNWDAVWPAAILGAIVLEAAKTLFAWYLTNLADFQVVYGGIATVIVLLLWAYLTACIFLICAELCSQLNLWMLGQHNTPRISVYTDASLAQLPAEIPPPV